MQRRFYTLMLAALAGVVWLSSASTAEATFAARITTLSNPGGTTIFDGGAGDLDGGPNGSITVNYGDASYRLIGTISFTNSPGDPNLAILDVSYNLSTLGRTGGAASLEVSSTGFTQPSDNPLTLTSSINGNGQGTGTLTMQQWANTSDTLFGHGPVTPGPQGPFAINAAGGYGSSASKVFNQVGPYSIDDLLSFNLSPGASTSGDSQSIVTSPAPAGLVLAAAGCPFLGFGFLRRFRKAKVAVA